MKQTLGKLLIYLIVGGMVLCFPLHRIKDDHVIAEEALNHQYKAITYNIHRGTNTIGLPSLPQIAQLLKDEAPDFVALQEVDRFKVRSGINDQISYLAEQLNMEYVFAPNIQTGLAQYGNGILSRYPILDWGQVKLPQGKEPRSLLWAKVMTETGDLYITSIHLGLDLAERTAHFIAMEDFLEQIEHTPVLLMGDFNILPSHSEMQSFYKRVTGKKLDQEIPTFYHKKANKDVQIDYIIGRDIEEIETYALPSKASDHYPLIMEFKIKYFPYPDIQREWVI